MRGKEKRIILMSKKGSTMQLNYILIATPDKISLNTFLKFIRKALGKDYTIGEMHSLMAEKDKELYATEFSQKFSKGVFSYYARGVKKIPDPLLILPTKAVALSEAVVWFDLYSTVPVVLKDTQGFLPPIIENWNKFIEKLNF